MLNEHIREIQAPADDVGRLLDTLASPFDEWWTSRMVAPMLLDRGLRVGSRGGHGSVRYTVVAYESGRFVEFRFDPRIGLDGVHRFVVEPTANPGGTRVSHLIDAQVHGWMRAAWPTIVRPIHDGTIEDVFDALQSRFTGRCDRQQPTSRWVRTLATWGSAAAWRSRATPTSRGHS